MSKSDTFSERTREPDSVSGMLGDATVELPPGQSKELLRPGSKIAGESALNPFEMIARMQARVDQTLESFAATSQEWQKVAKNVNGVMDTHRGHISDVVEEAAESMHQLTQTLTAANRIVGDPATQQNLRDTIAATPRWLLRNTGHDQRYSKRDRKSR